MRRRPNHPALRLVSGLARCAFVFCALRLVGCSDEPLRVSQREDVDLASAERCVSQTYWAQGDRGDPHMHPGRDCVGCHTRSARGPRFTVAGTVFSASHEVDDCLGHDGAAQIEVTDDTGSAFTIVANQVGNFYTTHAFRLPLRRVRVLGPRAGAVLEMGSAPPHGDCNACHSRAGTLTPTGTSPGRIIAPR